MKFLKNRIRAWHIIIFAFAVFFIFGVPAIINRLYISNLECITTVWNGGELLQFYGSILGGIATLVAVVMTIKHTDKQTINAKRELQEEKELDYQRRRTDEIIALYKDVNSYLDASYLLNLASHREIILKDPIKLLNTHRDAVKATKVDIHLNPSEKEKYKDSISKIKGYGEKYSALLWEIYRLTSQLKIIEQRFELSAYEHEQDIHQKEADSLGEAFQEIIDRLGKLHIDEFDAMITVMQKDLDDANDRIKMVSQ